MPGTPQPVGIGPNGLPPFWNAFLQATQGNQMAVNGLASGSSAGWVTDLNGNVTELYGANLNQVVTIAAAHLQAGVQVATGIPNGTAGHAVQSGPAITTITLTKGSASATVGAVTGAGLSAGQVIGAALVNDPTTGTPTPAITPGTTISTVSGTSVTLSQNAAESGTSLYCAAARFVVQQDTGWVPLTLASLWSAASTYYIPSVRLINDRVYFSGGISSGVSTPPSQFTTLPTAFRPAAAIAEITATTDGSVFNVLTVATSGAVSLSAPPTNETFDLDGLSYRLI